MRTTHKILLGTVLLSTVACQSATLGAPADEIPSTAIDEAFGDAGVRRVAHSFYNGFDQPVRAVIRDDESWQAAWTTLYIGMTPARPAPPAVDFSRSTVILVALGTRSTGGYDITVSRVARDAGVLYVEVTSTSPGDRCSVTQAFTKPVDIVVVPHTVDEAVFVERKTVHQC
jgi:protease stability complex PrcB-like protein